MTIDEIIALARSVMRSHSRHTEPSVHRMATAISALLAGPGDECDWERPVVRHAMVRIPNSWAAYVAPDDAEAMARMLLRAAEMAREGK